MLKPYYDKNGITIYCGNCLDVMPQLKILFDAIISDWPYGTTNCQWDSVIDLSRLWPICKQIVKPNAPIITTSSQPFTSVLICSNLEMYKTEWVWEKNHPKGHPGNAKKYPMKAHETIQVFCDGQPTYNPQMTSGHSRKTATRNKGKNSDVYNADSKTVKYDSTERYPRSVLTFKADTQQSSLHPTQKPLSLYRYLIRTYTNRNNIILDNAMGSGTTLKAAQDEGRQAVGIELSEDYCKIAVERLQQPSFFSIR